MKAKTIQELFGTLQQSIVTSWRKHLKSDDYSEHVILNDFYDDMLDAVDALVEGYMSYHGKVKDYVNLFDKTKSLSPKQYIQDLHDLVVNSRDLCGDEKEIQGCVDDVLKVIDTALYKLKELVKENHMTSLHDYIVESMKWSQARYELNVGDLQNDRNTRYIKMSDSYTDHNHDLFITKNGIAWCRNDYDFQHFDDILQMLGYDGPVVIGIADPASYGKKLKQGKKLYDALAPGRYKLLGDNYPFPNKLKIVKLSNPVISGGW